MAWQLRIFHALMRHLLTKVRDRKMEPRLLEFTNILGFHEA